MLDMTSHPVADGAEEFGRHPGLEKKGSDYLSRDHISTLFIDYRIDYVDIEAYLPTFRR